MPSTSLPPYQGGRPGRRPCRGPAQRPLPDPADLRLSAVPDTAPPYDDEVSADPGRRPGPVAAAGRPVPPVRPGEPARDGGHPGPPRPALPGQFALVLVETLAGVRPPRQLTSWTTERARSRIQRLGRVLSAGRQPRLRRVVACQPRPDVIEMTLLLSCGPQVRAVAVRLEQRAARPGPGGQPGRPARWCCTDVEAA